MRDCDYRTATWPTDQPGICLLEWDVALDLHDREVFVQEALNEPNKILVAPYWKSYGGALRLIHRQYPSMEPVEMEAPTTDLFGFGCVYLPNQMVQEFLAQKAYRNSGFTDTTFSIWHRRHYGPARLTWGVHPQHLHGD